MNSLGKDIRQLLGSQLGVAGPNRVHKTVEYDLVYIYLPFDTTERSMGTNLVTPFGKMQSIAQ